MSYKLSELGDMHAPDFHDGYLDGIHTTGKTVALALRHVSGDRFKMTLAGVETFRADQFLLGNIILDIEVTSGKRVQPEDLSILYLAPHPSVDRQVHEKHARLIESIITRIERRDVILFEVSSSYGCYISAICKGVDVRPLDKGKGRRP